MLYLTRSIGWRDKGWRGKRGWGRREGPVQSAKSKAPNTASTSLLRSVFVKTPKPSNIAEVKTALLSIWNDLPQFIDTTMPSFRFRKTLIMRCCSRWIFLQFKYWEGSWVSWHKSLKRLHSWRKRSAKFDLRLLNIQDMTACSLEKCCIRLNHIGSG